MELAERRVAILGLGLMGGSLALDLLELGVEVLGVDTDTHTEKLAQESGVRTADLDSALQDSDILVLATPVRAALRVLEQFRKRPPALELIIDLGSTKRQIVGAMDALPEQLAAVGGHPLCGKERSGFAEARAGLYRSHRFVLTPSSRSTSAARSLAEGLVHTIGAVPFHMDASQHDRLLGTASHLPYLLAVALVGAAEALGKEAEIWDVVSSGFLSTSRLAASDVIMMVDILTTNRDMALSALTRANGELERLRDLIEAGEPDGLANALLPLRQRRISLQVHPEPVNGT